MDIVEELKAYETDGMPLHSGNSLQTLIDRAIAEIERLRSLAGAVSPGPDAAEVLKPLRHKAAADELRATADALVQSIPRQNYTSLADAAVTGTAYELRRRANELDGGLRHKAPDIHDPMRQAPRDVPGYAEDVKAAFVERKPLSEFDAPHD